MLSGDQRPALCKPTRGAKFANVMFHGVTPKADKAEYKFDIEYDVVRHERIGLPREGVKPQLLEASAKQADAYLAPDKLVPVTGKLADIATQQVQGHSGTMDKARALYNYVFSTMQYDKSGTGWGRGDSGVGVRFQAQQLHGLPFGVHLDGALAVHYRRDSKSDFPFRPTSPPPDIAGYHCWAEFYDSKDGWVPVDISEAWKDKRKEDFFFGDLDVNRVQFSMGRDLVLSPPQAGEPLNYFIVSIRRSGRQKMGKRSQSVLVCGCRRECDGVCGAVRSSRN